MTKRILLTGASGGLGRRLQPLLMKKGYEVFTCDSDITDVHALAQALETLTFDYVLHLAAVTHSHDEALYTRVNVEGTRNLLSICSTKPVEKFIFMSSRAASEDGGSYARSKLEAERLVKSSPIPWVILRPAEVYGGSSSEALSTLASYIQKYRIAPIVGTGSYRVAPVWVENVLHATVAALSAPANQIYNLSGPEEFTYNELVARLENSLHVRVLKMHIPLPIIRGLAAIAKAIGSKVIVRDQIARLLCEKSTDSADAKRDLGFNPLTLAEGLKLLHSSQVT